MDTKALYEKIRTTGLDILRSEVADPRAELIRNYGYGFEMAFSSPDPYAELMEQIIREHDPRIPIDEAVDRLSDVLMCDADKVKALGVSMLEAFTLNLLSDLPTYDEVQWRLMREVMRHAAYLYEGVLDARAAMLSNPVTLGMTRFEKEEWVKRLNLYRSPGVTDDDVIREWMEAIFD